MTEDGLDKPGTGKWWIPLLWIVLASAAAHLWCLGSQFYLDDPSIISDSASIHSGVFWERLSGAWTNFGYVLQYKLFGSSPMGWHAVNWLLHTAVACALFAVGRELVRDGGGDGVAWFAALLFAVHPLASEIPNYARTQDLAWVTLFSLLACRALIGFLREGRWFWLLGTVLGIAGATMSKGPGFFHALMMTGAVGFAAGNPGAWRRAGKHWRWLVPLLLAAVAVLWFSRFLPNLWRATSTWSEPRIIGHAYTLARVFWEFAWRALLPVSLCSDHQIAETMVPKGAGWLGVTDTVAKASMLGLLALTAFSLWLAWRRPTRVFGVCVFLFAATMLFRVMYLVPEFMPEYRIYPGLPWFCLGAAVLLGALWKRVPGDGSPRVFAVLILLPCVVLSARRSFVWHDLDRLCGDVLEQYPAQGRAVWELHNRDLTKGDWLKIIDRQKTLWPGVFQSFIEQTQKLAPVRDLNSGHFALADVACQGRYAMALAHTQGPAAGIAEIRRLEIRMHQLGIKPSSNRTIWGYFHHAKATILEMAGDFPGALESMRFEGVYKFTQADIDRLERKIAEKRSEYGR